MTQLSWLNTTIGDANEPILRAQLEYLHTELNHANDQLDQNFSRLEAAGLSGVELAEKFAEALERIDELEEELRGLTQRNKASLALVTAQRDTHGYIANPHARLRFANSNRREAETKTQEALKAVHEQMSSLKSDMNKEKQRLQKENGRLQDLVSELRLKSQKEVESFRAEMTRMAEESEMELKEAEEARRVAVEERERLKKVC